MKFVFINDNRVKKKVDTDEETAFAEMHLFQTVICVDGMTPEPDVDWIWDNGLMYRDIPSVTPRQIRQALILSGVSLEAIEAALGTLPEPTRSLAKTEWEYSVAFERRRPLVVQVGVMLGWSSDQLDELWLFAGKIK